MSSKICMNDNIMKVILCYEEVSCLLLFLEQITTLTYVLMDNFCSFLKVSLEDSTGTEFLFIPRILSKANPNIRMPFGYIIDQKLTQRNYKVFFLPSRLLCCGKMCQEGAIPYSLEFPKRSKKGGCFNPLLLIRRDIKGMKILCFLEHLTLLNNFESFL